MNTKGKSIASLVCSIVGLVAAWFGYTSIISLALGIVAVVLAVGVRKANDENKSMATAGLVMGIISIVLGGICLACVICSTCAYGGALATLAAAGY